ncbi:MAG TPA: isochorismatase family protein [Dehalococcoidia bacterium]|nr:isochorismatase family protein [Dehalococcoidia bacterium]
MSTVASRPYRWPYHGDVKPEQTGVLVFSDLDGPPSGSPALANLEAFIERARRTGMTVVHLPGADSEPPISVLPGDLTCRRPAYGAFTGTDLELLLRGAGLSDLLLAGFPVELGADCSMREANDLGYECLLLEDCCTALSDQTLAGAVSSVQMSGGIFGAVATSEEVIAALTSSSEEGTK